MQTRHDKQTNGDKDEPDIVFMQKS